MVNLIEERQLLKGLNIYLIGMMGAGKTTVGQLLAQQLQYRFFDTDVLLSQVAGQSVSEIFASSGEDTFRELESKVLSELSAYTYLVAATGGGIVLRRENWSYLQQGLVVWLDVPIEILTVRLESDKSRPLLQDGNLVTKLESLWEQRQKLYAQADLRITIDGEETPEQIALRVVQTIPQVLKSKPIPPDN